MDIFSWDGTLSSTEFSLADWSFVQKWKKLNPSFPPWSWVASQKQPGISSREVEGCSSLENICLLRLNEEDRLKETCAGEEETIFSKEEEPIDTATLELPYLNRLWYKLHPCGTSEWMKLLFLGDIDKTKSGCKIL